MGLRSATIPPTAATPGALRYTPPSMTCSDGQPPTWDAVPSISSEFCPRPHTKSSGSRTGTSERPSPRGRAGRATYFPTTAWPSLSWFLPVQEGRQLVYHSGSDPGFASAVLLSPSEQIGVVVLINASGAD